MPMAMGPSIWFVSFCSRQQLTSRSIASLPPPPPPRFPLHLLFLLRKKLPLSLQHPALEVQALLLLVVLEALFVLAVSYLMTIEVGLQGPSVPLEHRGCTPANEVHSGSSSSPSSLEICTKSS